MINVKKIFYGFEEKDIFFSTRHNYSYLYINLESDIWIHDNKIQINRTNIPDDILLKSIDE